MIPTRPSILKRKYVVNKELQVKVLLHSFATTSFACLAIICGSLILGGDPSTAKVATVVGMVLILTAAIFISSLLLSHAIAGPIYRIENEIKKVLSGEAAENIQIRNSDHFKAFAVTCNQMLAHYRVQRLASPEGEKLVNSQELAAQKN